MNGTVIVTLTRSGSRKPGRSRKHLIMLKM
jgi:hypothetical protein